MEIDRADIDILIDIKSGERVHAAFNELISKYGQYVQYIALGELGINESKADIEDIKQEVFVKVWSSRSKLKPELGIKNLLYKITKQKCSDFRRNHLRYRKYLSHYSSEQKDKIEQPGVRDMYLSEVLHNAIENIPSDTTRVIMKKRIMEEKEYDEITEETGISVVNARVYVNRGLNFIRNFLKKSL